MNQKLVSAAFIGATLVGPFVCVTCKDKGTVYRKAWAQAHMVEAVQRGEIHPAIAARSGAYRTIVEVTCPDCQGKPMPETREESLKRFAEEDKKFAELQAADAWPAKTCVQCVAGCCQRAFHHVGGLCLHCGMDERRVSQHP